MGGQTLRLAKGLALLTIIPMALNRWTLSKWIAAWWLGLTVFLAGLPAFGGGRYCVVDGWGTGEGLLPQSSIISMVQTHDGYLWSGPSMGWPVLMAFILPFSTKAPRRN